MEFNCLYSKQTTSNISFPNICNTETTESNKILPTNSSTSTQGFNVRLQIPTRTIRSEPDSQIIPNIKEISASQDDP